MKQEPQRSGMKEREAQDDSYHLQVENKIRVLRQAIDELRQRLGKDNVPKEHVVEDVFQELWSTLEELQVAQEELYIQNEELMTAQNIAETERLRYLDLLEGAPDGYVVTDAHGTIREANLAAARMLGLDEHRCVGKPLAVFVTQEDRRGFYGVLNELQYSGKGVQDWEVRIEPREGPPIDAAISASIVPASGSEAGAVRWLIRDISERKRTEKALRVYMAKLERSNRELQDFAFIASHDLQEPLRKIQTFGSRLNTEYHDALDDKGRDYLQRMHGSAKRMSDLITALLGYSRVTSERGSFTEVDLNALMKEILTDLEWRIEEKGGRVEVGELPTVEADLSQMHQLFQNLIGNALKYHGEDAPLIRITGKVLRGEDGEKFGISHSGDLCQILVEDSGIGFKEEFIERIFRPFQRLHGRRRKYEGTGMGLAICRKIVERHGGSLTAKSEPGKGAVFIVTLSVKQGESVD